MTKSCSRCKGKGLNNLRKVKGFLLCESCYGVFTAKRATIGQDLHSILAPMQVLLDLMRAKRRKQTDVKVKPNV
jgi:hypothetical protein